tara:strand:- start:297 stop:572 length:276 start_codon:yes stop_codon:yes gene_type:complete
MTQVLIPTALQRFVNQQETLQLEGSTVGDVLDELTTQFGELKQHLYDKNGNLRSFVNVFINNEDIRHQEGLSTKIGDQDTLTIVPSIAGGR